MKDIISEKQRIFKLTNDITMKGEIAIFGSTFMAEFPLYECLIKARLDRAIYNRSIAGMTTDDALQILDSAVISIRPEKVFLSLGECDSDLDRAVKNYSEIISKIRNALPDCEIYVLSLPWRDEKYEAFNNKLKGICTGKMVEYIGLVKESAGAGVSYPSTFRRLCAFFRSQSITFSDAFAISSL